MIVANTSALGFHCLRSISAHAGSFLLLKKNKREFSSEMCFRGKLLCLATTSFVFISEFLGILLGLPSFFKINFLICLNRIA